MDRHNFLQTACLTLFALAVSAACAWGYVRPGGLSGSVELAYADYRQDLDDGTAWQASSLSQNYSLLWNMVNGINGGAGGYYRLGLGYEWSALDAEFNGESRSISRGKLLYQGRVVVAPGGLPFRLEAYSEDVGGNSFSSVPLSYYSRLSSDLLRYDIMNGQHIETGVTFWAGIRNGSYLGQYRDILANYPRIFVDYRETLVKDDERLEPVHYRMRDLAFVSLNKKDNWFHYRFFDYTDYIRPSEDYQQKMFLIGTIDHRNERQWIHMTNWIKTSVDLSTTISKSESGAGGNPIERSYVLNAFTQASRRNFEVSNFTTFSRTITQDRIERSLDIPVYGLMRFDGSDERLRYAVSYHKDENEDSNGKVLSFEDSAYGRVDYEFNRNERWTTKPFASVGWVNDIGGQLQFVKGGLERLTNARVNQREHVLLGATIGYWSGDASTDDTADDTLTTTDFAEITAYGDYQLRLNGGLSRLSIGQRFWLGSGEWAGGASIRDSPQSGEALEEVTGGQRGSEFGSITSLAYSSQLQPRLHHTVGLTNDFLTGDAGTHLKLYMQEGLSYGSPTLGVTMDNELNYVVVDDLIDASGAGAEGFGDGYWEFTHESRLNWLPNRAWKMDAGLDYMRFNYANGAPAYENYRLSQGLEYKMLTTRGIQRTLFTVGQGLEWSQAKRGAESYPWRLGLNLFASYYPRRNLSLWVRSSYETYEGNGSSLYYGAGLSLQRNKFTFTLAYRYGVLDETANGQGATERLLEAKVKRVF